MFAAADAAGMKRGLWSLVALIDYKSKAYTDHPDWACIEPNGKPRLSTLAGALDVLMYLATLIDTL